jgi:hypothetical protein
LRLVRQVFLRLLQACRLAQPEQPADAAALRGVGAAGLVEELQGDAAVDLGEGREGGDHACPAPTSTVAGRSPKSQEVTSSRS